MGLIEFFTVGAILSAQPVHVLLVEDDEIDVESVRRAFTAFKITNPITAVSNGYEALDVLRGEEGRQRLPRPYVILLDLNMPQMNGLEFLQHLRQDEELKSSVVFVLTTSSSEADMIAAYSSQVAGYILKTHIGEEMLNLPRFMKDYWRVVELPLGR